MYWVSGTFLTRAPQSLKIIISRISFEMNRKESDIGQGPGTVKDNMLAYVYSSLFFFLFLGVLVRRNPAEFLKRKMKCLLLRSLILTLQ